MQNRRLLQKSPIWLFSTKSTIGKQNNNFFIIDHLQKHQYIPINPNLGIRVASGSFGHARKKCANFVVLSL